MSLGSILSSDSFYRVQDSFTQLRTVGRSSIHRGKVQEVRFLQLKHDSITKGLIGKPPWVHVENPEETKGCGEVFNIENNVESVFVKPLREGPEEGVREDLVSPALVRRQVTRWRHLVWCRGCETTSQLRDRWDTSLPTPEPRCFFTVENDCRCVRLLGVTT